MAFLVKRTTTGSRPGVPMLRHYIHKAEPAQTLPATTSATIFKVDGGRVRVLGLLGQITTVVQTQTTNTKITSTAKSGTSGGTTVGTAVDIASNVDLSAAEVGALLWVEGDGTAMVKSNAGGAFIGTNTGEWIAPIGIIQMTTAATSTGAVQWDLWYEPLDEGAYVTAA